MFGDRSDFRRKRGEKGGGKGATSQERYELGAFGARNVRIHV